MRSPILVCCVVLCATFCFGQSTTVKSPLTRLLEAELDRIPADIGIYVKNLRTHEDAGVRADQQHNSMSVIKLAIMVLAYQLADQKSLDLNERVEITPNDFRLGSGILRSFGAGLRPTVRDLIGQMTITSDNTATDLLIAKVGGVERVNRWLKDNGYRNLSLTSTTYEWFAKFFALYDPRFQNMSPRDLYEAATLDPDDPSLDSRQKKIADDSAKAYGSITSKELAKRMKEGGPNLWLGSMNARETGRLLESIESGTAASKQACYEMGDFLARQLMGMRRLSHFVNVQVLHKTGDAPVIANDVGIMYAKSGPIVVAMFVESNELMTGEVEDQTGMVERSIVDYFDGHPSR